MYSQATDVFVSACVTNLMHAVQQMLSIQSEILCIAYTKMAEYADQRPAASIMKAKFSKMHWIKMPEQIGPNVAQQRKTENLQYCTKLTFHCAAMQSQFTKKQLT